MTIPFIVGKRIIVLNIMDHWMLMMLGFFVKRFIDKLIDSYSAVFNDTKFYRMITFVNSFNLKDAHVVDR